MDFKVGIRGTTVVPQKDSHTSGSIHGDLYPACHGSITPAKINRFGKRYKIMFTVKNIGVVSRAEPVFRQGRPHHDSVILVLGIIKRVSVKGIKGD